MDEFGRFRALFFPIYKHEMKKFLGLGLMMFFILFNYTILRDTKDALVVGAAGAEALSLIKLIGTVPGAIIIMLVYSKLSNLFSRKQMFFISVIPFMLFFALFAYVIYPNLDLLHPSSQWVESVSAEFPRLRTFAHVVGNWSYALFYVLAELWGSVVLSLLFWQFANDSVNMKEARRFYSLFGVIANFGAIGAGLSVQYFSKMRAHLAPGIDPWGTTLNSLMGAVVLSCLGLLFVYRWINKTIEVAENISPKKRPKLGLKESLLYLIRSRHLGLVALLVICYGISINVIEAVWKDQVKQVFGNLNEISYFMGKFSAANGVLTIVFMLIGGFIVRRYGWGVSAALTPLMILVMGSLFFSCILFRNSLLVLGLAPSLIAVWIGFIQNMLCKSTKYALFDPTKEMCYIPLDEEAKVKGKAAVDVVGARLGKSGGSIIQQVLLVSTGSSLVGIAPVLGIVLAVVTLTWVCATRALNRSLEGAGQLVEATKG